MQKNTKLLIKMAENNGMTKQELADKAKIHRNTIRSMIQGEFEPNRSTILQVANALDATPAEIGYPETEQQPA